VHRSDLEKLWEAAAGIRGRYRRYKWVAVLGILYGTGLRRGELEGLSIEDWNSDESTLRVFGRKTGAERILPVTPGVSQCIEAYLPQRQNCLEKAGRLEERALLVSSSGSRMTGPQIGIGIRRLAARAGIPHVTPHQFRHTCASDLLESGVSLPLVRDMLGHSEISTTMRYLHVADPERHKAMQRHPINAMLSGEIAQ
jgi:site-specific recombinase XerD